MSASVLKLLLMLDMLIDHIGKLWGITEFSYIGRLAFPLFAFFVADGWRRTRDKWAYARRMMLFAVISELPYLLMTELIRAYPPVSVSRQMISLGMIVAVLLVTVFVYGVVPKGFETKHLAVVLPFLALHGMFARTSVLYTFAGAMLCLWIMETDAEKIPASAKACLVMTLMFCFGSSCDYSFLGVMLTVLLGRLPDSRPVQSVCIVLWALATQFLVYIGLSLWYLPGMLLAALVIFLYRPEKGAPPVWFRRFGYWFYPVHMAVLGGLCLLLRYAA